MFLCIPSIPFQNIVHFVHWVYDTYLKEFLLEGAHSFLKELLFNIFQLGLKKKYCIQNTTSLQSTKHWLVIKEDVMYQFFSNFEAYEINYIVYHQVVLIQLIYNVYLNLINFNARLDSSLCYVRVYFLQTDWPFLVQL